MVYFLGVLQPERPSTDRFISSWTSDWGKRPVALARRNCSSSAKFSSRSDVGPLEDFCWGDFHLISGRNIGNRRKPAPRVEGSIPMVVWPMQNQSLIGLLRYYLSEHLEIMCILYQFLGCNLYRRQLGSVRSQSQPKKIARLSRRPIQV